MSTGDVLGVEIAAKLLGVMPRVLRVAGLYSSAHSPACGVKSTQNRT